MPTKAQAKTAIDSAATQIKADIDNILPVGVNIKDGVINFGPIRWTLILDAGGNTTTAENLVTAITANLTGASRAFTINRAGRRVDDSTSGIQIVTQLAVYTIINFDYTP